MSHTHTELMYDATPDGVPFIPHDAQIVAGYVDGHYVSFPALVRRFPRAKHVSIGVFLGHTAEFSDVEAGNPINTPNLVRADYEFRKAHGVWKPGYYGDMGHLANVILPGLTGIPRSEYRLWLADWDGNPNNLPDVDCAKQYTSNQHYDVSVVDPARMFPEPPPHPPHPHHIPIHPIPHPPIPTPKPSPKPHPKVLGSTVAAGLATAIQGVLHAAGLIHLTPAEYSAITSFCAAVGGWVVPSSPKSA